MSDQVVELSPETMQERRRAAARLARWQTGFVGLLTVLCGVGAFVFGWNELEAPLVVLSAFLGFLLPRAFTSADEEERVQHELLTLTSIYYQDPTRLRDMLLPDAVDRAIANLLNAALGDDKVGQAFWEQAVGPFIHRRGTGYKRDWRYQIHLIELDEEIKVTIDKHQARFDRTDYRRLHTTVTYEQSVDNPAELYYVAVVFETAELPSWFKKENFLLREATDIPLPCVEMLAPFGPFPAELPTRLEDVTDDHRKGTAPAALWSAAETLLDASVWIGEEQLKPEAIYASGRGLSWGFLLSPETREAMRSGANARVDLKTLLSKATRSFPVNINAPTHHPTILFHYGKSDIAAGTVAAEVFFSAARPYDARLRSYDNQAQTIEVRTEADDWVFRGSGCLFVW